LLKAPFFVNKRGVMNLAIILRVYNRINDLKINIDIIRKFWKSNNYFIICSHNGKDDGYLIPDDIKPFFDVIVETKNDGHLTGNSKLIFAALEYIPQNTDYVVLLEADTWIFDDALIYKYTNLMMKTGSVWASAEWIEKYYTLGLDFAIIDYNFIKSNSKIFGFSKHAESFVANYLINNNFKYLYIKELMPVHIPSLLRKIYNPTFGRFRVFLKANMITHHIEELKEGMEEKKFYANLVLGYRYFDTSCTKNYLKEKIKLCLIDFFLPIIPKSKWFKRKKIRKV